MNNITFIAGSLPSIVTAGPQRRVNKDGLNDIFLKKYIELIGKLLLLKKKNLNDIKMVYIGGYKNKEGDKDTLENINTAKLYFSALSFYLKELGYGNLNKVNLTIIDSDSLTQNELEVKEKLENADFLFLGIGQDQIFGELLDLFQSKNISLKDIILRNNIIVASVCAGTVISSENIYGGSYDTFYYNRPSFIFPKSYNTLGINPVTIEPNYNSSSKDEKLNQEFRLTCLIPDSKNKVFFASSANSFFAINQNSIYVLGAVSLFINGEEFLITKDGEGANITYLNSLVNAYNEKPCMELFSMIKKEIEGLKKFLYEDDNPYIEIVDTFKFEEEKLMLEKDKKANDLKKVLKRELISLFQDKMYVRFNVSKLNINFLESLNLESNEVEEIYLKFYMIAIIKKYSNLYVPNYVLYYALVYEVIQEIALDYPTIVYYFTHCFSAMYPNGEIKKLLKLIDIKPNMSVNELSKANRMRMLLKN